MNELSVIPANSVSFKEFLWGNRRNKMILNLVAIAIVIQFIIFKYLYPFASFIFGDSFSYIETAEQNLDINTYMVGYSRFLRFFSVFTSSDTALVAFQYLLIQVSTLFLLFTVFYFYKPSRLVQTVLLAFMVLNPLYLHLGNLVSSDCLFAALSITWFAVLLWLIHRPSNELIVWQAVLIFATFTVRYNALIYPFIAAVAFYLSSLSLRKKLIGIVAGLVLCGLFVFYTSYKYKQLTGYWQYSPFSGWQLTNNAMYAYRYVDAKDRKPVPRKFQAFDNMVREYFDSTRDVSKHPQEAMEASTVYMWTPDLSMFKYRDSLFRNDSSAIELKKWASMGPFYKSYGLFIIRQYPWKFIRHFLWPNANKYYAPQVEFLQLYNSGRSKVITNAMNWFKYKTTEVRIRMKSNNVWVLNFYPILFGISNVIMFLTLICYVLLKGWKTKPYSAKGILMGSAVWIINATFTIGASSPALRFQCFPILLTTVFVALLLEWLWKVAMSREDSTAQTELEMVSVINQSALMS
ncbi:hypothetical protein [Niastella populi]|uniref:Glycosyltransferase RgtA/B/C/D-like domain-containing protein n=1 Tax=Niastella populi TaxID=550983 RepID=A0A1V9GAV0_9BACT|nr:hypothetical protein [Niastella populi]OQP67789.1 hypothetical protein A4R26_32850 [Niastella populi]